MNAWITEFSISCEPLLPPAKTPSSALIFARSIVTLARGWAMSIWQLVAVTSVIVWTLPGALGFTSMQVEESARAAGPVNVTLRIVSLSGSSIRMPTLLVPRTSIARFSNSGPFVSIAGVSASGVIEPLEGM